MCHWSLESFEYIPANVTCCGVESVNVRVLVLITAMMGPFQEMLTVRGMMGMLVGAIVNMSILPVQTI